MSPRRAAQLVLLGSLAAAAPAVAQPGPEYLETLEGPTRMDALLGNGRLTAGLADDGVVTLLRWPSPSFHDQLSHRAARASAQTPDPRALPRFGAARTGGLFLGVVVDDGTGPRVLGLDDPSLGNRSQGYTADTSRAARFSASGDAVALTQTAAVLAGADVLVLALDVAPQRPLRRLEAFVFAHPAPTARKLPAWPVADVWLDDPASDDPNGFAAVAAPGADAVVAVAPFPNLRQRAWRLAFAAAGGVAAREVDARALLQAVEPVTAVALALGCDRPAQRQVGLDDGGLGVLRPRDALADLGRPDLEGNAFVLGDATVALRAALPVSGASSVAFYVALGATPARALEELAAARSVPASELLREVEQDLGILREVALPDTDSAAPRAAALRALLALEALSDAQTGAVVASTATQPALPMDRPTDAALVDVAWAHGGRIARAVEHRALWASWQRPRDDGIGPRGSYAGGFYADGEVASPVGAPLDAVGLSLWAMGAIEERSLKTLELADPTSPVRELAAGARLAVDALLGCVDQVRQLPCPAAEWDWPGKVQGAWTAAAAVAGLRAGVVMMAALGDGGRRDGALARLHVLRQGLDRLLVEPAETVPLHALALALGEAEALEDEPGLREALLDQALDRAEAVVSGAGEPAKVFPLVLWQLLVASRGDGQRRARAEELLDRLVRTGLTPFGHAGLAAVAGEGGAVSQRIGMPAAAAEATLYLALLERHGRRPPPSLPVPDLENCGCPDVRRRGDPGLGIALLPLGLAVLTHRGRRRGGGAGPGGIGAGRC